MGSQGRCSSCWHCCAAPTPVPSFWFSQACYRIAHVGAHTHYCLCLRLPRACTKLSSLLFSSAVLSLSYHDTSHDHRAGRAVRGHHLFFWRAQDARGQSTVCRDHTRVGEGSTRKGPVAIATGDRNLTGLTFYPGQFLRVRVRLGHILQLCTIFCRGISYCLKFRSE